MNKKSLIIALTALITPALFALCYFVLFPDPPLARVFYFASRAVFILLPVLWTMYAEKKRFPRPRPKGDGIRMGIVSGTIIGITAIILYANVFTSLPVENVQNRAVKLGFAGNLFFLFAVFLIIMNSSLEEYYWRWFGFSKLKEVFPTWPSILLSGVGFALHHVIILVVFFGWGPGLFFGFFVGVGGSIWCWFYDRYDSIWPSWISHAIVDAALMFIGYDMLFCR